MGHDDDVIMPRVNRQNHKRVKIKVVAPHNIKNHIAISLQLFLFFLWIINLFSIHEVLSHNSFVHILVFFFSSLK